MELESRFRLEMENTQKYRDQNFDKKKSKSRFVTPEEFQNGHFCDYLSNSLIV